MGEKIVTNSLYCLIQVKRAQMRLAGIESMLELLKTKDIITSVKYYLLNGWQGLVQVGVFGYLFKAQIRKYTHIFFS